MDDATITTVPGREHGYYDGSRYWNDHEVVRRRLNERATGDPATTWYEALQHEGRHFRRGLVLNCGNGWVERDLLRLGIVDEIVGIDISDELLAQARAAAAAHGYRADYRRVDINVDALPEGPFDLVLNHAAGHHIAKLDRVFRHLAAQLEPDGLFVNWDYVGPHRNQYSTRQWEAAWRANESLPDDLRQDLVYPHLPTMLVTDPTEAVHSELILATVARYFDVVELRPLGGAVAYPLLTHNHGLDTVAPERAAPWIERVLAADDEFLAAHPDETLFAYVVARPRSPQALAGDDLARWTAEEDARERAAAANGGEYYPRTLLGTLYCRLDDLERRVEQVQAQAVEAPPPVTARARRAVVARFPGAADRYRSLRQRWRSRASSSA